MSKKKKVLLDTDIGGDIDDAACLAYLLMQPDCELLGITTVSGNLDVRAMVADAICRVASKKVPIYPGLDNRTPNGWHPIPEGAVNLKNWEHSKTFERNKAIDFLYETICRFPNEVYLLGIGSFSNIAALFQTYPDAAEKVEELIVMAGVFDDEMNNSDDMPYCNWNVWSDPISAEIMFRKAKRIRVYGLEVTSKLTMTQEQVRSLFTSDILNAVADFGEPWLSNHIMTYHDPLVATALFTPELCTYEQGYIKIDLEAEDERSYAKTTFVPDENGNCELAVSVDGDGFFESYFKVFHE
ncbi:MAG: nucleoside hydrolase [Clostridia bacterium]|jgi:purine nucleosidase